jgi:hypothetical protein
MARLDFASGIVAANTGVSTIPFGGDDYLGVGTFGDVSPVSESVASKPYSISLTLSGVPAALISVTLNEQYQGRDAKIFLAMLDSEHQLIADPVLLFRGRIDTMDMVIGETATISMTVQSRMADWDKPRVRRYNHEDQIVNHPTDKGFEFTPQMVERTLVWGRA